MRAHRAVALAICLLAIPFIASPASAAACDNVEVTFADANLEVAVREAIEKPTGAILDCDLVSLKRL